MSGFPYNYQIDRMGEVMPPEAPPISGRQSSDIRVPIVGADLVSQQATPKHVPEILSCEGVVGPDELLGYAAYQATGGAMGLHAS